MRQFFFCFLFLFYNTIYAQGFVDPKIAGIVHLEKGHIDQFDGKGVLVVKAFVVKDGSLSVFAETKIEKPHFPQLFLIGPKNILQKGHILVGSYEIKAEYYPHGVAGQSGMMGGQDAKFPVAPVGKKDLVIKLDFKQ